jgi:DhnA family fructose-bisphosphate aldolase class Ia
MNGPTHTRIPGRLGNLSIASVGKLRRFNHIFPESSGKTVTVPLDDSLIFGPVGGLERVPDKLLKIIQEPPDAILAFQGLFRTCATSLSMVPMIVNLTASTCRSQHTRKVLVSTVERAVQLGADAVAVHVNVTSKFEREMLKMLGSAVHDCEVYGMPLLAIMYPRRESSTGDDNYDTLRESDRHKYAELVAHAVRIAADLGADFIKTKYTGDPESFSGVIEAANPIPVIIAGGPAVPFRALMQIAFDSISVGGAGVSFGRNVFSRDEPQPYITALKSIVHMGHTPDQAIAALNSSKLSH